MNLSDIFTIVLENAIEAQYRANQYSAKLAKDTPPLQATGDPGSKVKDASYYPIPNSVFQNINVNLKVKLQDIKADVKKTVKKIFAANLSRLSDHLPGFEDIIRATDPNRITVQLLNSKQTLDDQTIISASVRYLSLYLFYFERYLKSEKPSIKDDKMKKLQHIEEKVLLDLKELIGQHGADESEERFKEIHATLEKISVNIDPYKNMVFEVDNENGDDNKLCNIGISLDMRTFSWANYDNK